MRTVKVRNVNESWRVGMSTLLYAGETEESRNGPVIVYPEPFTTVYSKPMERVLFSPLRKANPFFHLFESMWMLAGRRDGAYLDTFVHDFSERYAEEDGNLHGAYGYRWMTGSNAEVWGDRSQLEVVIDLLKKDPTTRQAVLAMWHPGEDLGAAVKDKPCLAGDTIVWSPEGDLTIKELAAKFEAGEVTQWPVFGVIEDTKEVKLTWCTAAWKSGNKKTIKITFDDKSSIRLTKDHILYRRNRRAIEAYPIEAGSLRPGDRILATQLWTMSAKKPYLSFKKSLGENTNYRNMQPIHTAYDVLLRGPCSREFDRHHINGNVQDNRSVNIERKNHSDHISDHMSGANNPMAKRAGKRRPNQSIAMMRRWREGTKLDRAIKESIDNHVIVSIEECEAEEVFDFTVPETHTAIIGTGVVTHNCNTHIYYRISHGHLHQTVLNRSNDAIWGCWGANAVHMSVLHEFVAACVGLPVGMYWQVSNNLHAYQATINSMKLTTANIGMENCDLYAQDKVSTSPMFPIGHTDASLSDLLADWTYAPLAEHKIPEQHRPLFDHLLTPMLRTWMWLKDKQPLKARDECLSVGPADWRAAASQWSQRAVEHMTRTALERT